MHEKMQDLSDEEFNSNVNAVMVNVSEKDLSQSEVFRRFWNEIDDHTYLFDRQQRNVDMLPKIKKEDL
jgi:secreted Zn-dependent insulinase-like peptidase